MIYVYLYLPTKRSSTRSQLTFPYKIQFTSFITSTSAASPSIDDDDDDDFDVDDDAHVDPPYRFELAAGYTHIYVFMLYLLFCCKFSFAHMPVSLWTGPADEQNSPIRV